MSNERVISEQIECPLCHAKGMEYSKVKHLDGEESHFWSCQECPATLMEFHTDRDALAFIGRTGDERALKIVGMTASHPAFALTKEFFSLMSIEQQIVNNTVFYLVPASLMSRVEPFLQELMRLTQADFPLRWTAVHR